MKKHNYPEQIPPNICTKHCKALQIDNIKVASATWQKGELHEHRLDHNGLQTALPSGSSTGMRSEPV